MTDEVCTKCGCIVDPEMRVFTPKTDPEMRAVTLNFEELGMLCHLLMQDDDFRNAALRGDFEHPADIHTGTLYEAAVNATSARMYALWAKLAATQDTMR